MKLGRPTKMTPETIKKLEEAFLLGCTDGEACFYADISHETLYNYQEKNPDFTERKNKLKENPYFLARQSIIKGFSNPELALKYMERKKKDEFSLRTELTGENGKALKITFDDVFSDPSNSTSPETKGNNSTPG